jgi:hypothetical protein
MAIPSGYQAVSVYLPPDLAEAIESYALENGISRKGKEGEIRASLGTAIVNLLSSTLLNSTSNVLSNVQNDVLNDVLERLDKLENITSTLSSTSPVPVTGKVAEVEPSKPKKSPVAAEHH